MERIRLISLADDKEHDLQEQIRVLEQQEAERKNKKKQKAEDNTILEHYIEGQIDFNGVSEKEIEE